MKFLSDKTYNDLLEKADANKSKEREGQIVKEYEEKIERQGKIHREEIEGLEKKADNLAKDNEIIVTRKDLELENKVAEATKVLTKENAELKMNLNNKTKEAEILTKAFENLGFDVKDMKDILNKLVDGLVGKNTVHIVK
jgi:hypothetical protein